MRWGFILLFGVMLGCVHQPARVDRLSPASRLFAACQEFARSGYEAQRIAGVLAGQVMADGSISGIDFARATHERSATLEAIHVDFEAETRFTVDSLQAVFGVGKRSSDGERIYFTKADKPCGQLQIVAKVTKPQVKEGALIGRLSLRRTL